jgi:hypothetical protein
MNPRRKKFLPTDPNQKNLKFMKSNLNQQVLNSNYSGQTKVTEVKVAYRQTAGG